MENGSAFTDLVEYIVKSIVDNPDQVTVSQHDEGATVMIEVTVSESDMGRVIGRGGSVVTSIRSLVQVLAAKQGKRVTLEII
ncbi:MAG: KH domain-containing protein [Chloroflexota bacterium]